MLATSKSRIDALTGLRFFAALVVMLSHLPKPAYLPGALATFFSAGYNGVTIFFVLSGFVIGLNYFDALARPNAKALIKFFLARGARIYPLYFFVLFYIWLESGAPLVDGAAVHFLALQTWSPILSFAYGFNPPGWSIGVELFMYACFPLLAIVLAPWRNNSKVLWGLAVGVTIVLIALAFWFRLSGGEVLPIQDPNSAHRWLYRTPLTRLGDFILGIVAALLFNYHSSKGVQAHSERIWSILVYVSLAGLVFFMLLPANLNSAFSWDVSCAPFAFVLLLGLALAQKTWLARMLATRPLIILGEASYALYLIHVSLINKFGISRFLELDPWILIVGWLMFGLLAILLSISLNVYVETPIRRMINSGASRLDQAPRSI